MWVRVARFEGGTPEGLDAEMAPAAGIGGGSSGEYVAQAGARSPKRGRALLLFASP